MIKQIFNRITYSLEQEDYLNSILKHDGAMWYDTKEEIKQLKESIRSQLCSFQDSCAYCGLELGGTSDGQIEHIAPKAKYSDFTFEKENLVMACHYCNGFSKKGNHHTISKLEAIYSKCEFKLVHPYYDDPDVHYQWLSKDKKIVIQKRTDKGKYSIEVFKLDAPVMAELRGKKIIAEIVINNTITPQIDDDLIQKVLDYKKYH